MLLHAVGNVVLLLLETDVLSMAKHAWLCTIHTSKGLPLYIQLPCSGWAHTLTSKHWTTREGALTT